MHKDMPFVHFNLQTAMLNVAANLCTMLNIAVELPKMFLVSKKCWKWFQTMRHSPQEFTTTYGHSAAEDQKT